MNQIIKIEARQIGDAQVQTVNARDLHAFLEVGKDFSTWIKARIEQYEFAEGADFLSYESGPQNGGAGNRGSRIDYALTLDMAKELAMVERNAKGKEARQYFIKCEQRAKAAVAVDPMEMLNDPAAMRGMLLTYTNKVIELNAVVAEQAPKVETHDRIADAAGSLCVTDAAKVLDVSPRKLSYWMQQDKWLYRRGGKNLIGYQDKVQAGYLTHKVSTVQNIHTGEDKIVEQVRVTPRGITALAKRLPPEMRTGGRA